MRAIALAAVLVVAPSSSGATGPRRDIPTGEHYRGKAQNLPTFPHIDTVNTRGQVIVLASTDADSPARLVSGTPTATAETDLASGYWVIGPRAWADAAAPLVRTRHALGMPAEYVAVEDLLAGYPDAIDEAGSLREALRDAYESGVRYALLLGGRTQVPVRYASDVRCSEPVALDQLQICDLYFGEFDGDWDSDGDGIYGEPYEDSADIGAEVYVGRVPVSSVSALSAWVAKWQDYVLARGDTGYLNRSLGLASDQMRDDDSGSGQAAMVGRVLPAVYEQDTTSLLEEPTGLSDTPSGPWAANVLDEWNRGWGIVHVFAHGRWDGFAPKTSAYDGWPKSYLLTATETSGSHVSLTRLSGAAGIVYSVACNQAAFDADTALGAPAGQRCVATELLANPNGGAVAFVGYSRWGWVFSSYRVAQVFWQGIFDSSYTLGAAMQMAKLRYPYLRDACYGHNVYGDPAMHVWAGEPERLEIDCPSWASSAGGIVTVQVGTSGLEAPPAYTVMTSSGEILASGSADPDGRITFELPTLEPQPVVFTAICKGYAPFQDTIHTSLAVGVDDEPVVPARLNLVNYPNPFNAGTQIEFTLPGPDRVDITIYNTLGRVVYRWRSEAPVVSHSFTWDGRTESGFSLPSGVYLARLTTAKHSVVTRRLLLLK